MPSEMEVRKSIRTMLWCLLVAAVICDAKYYRIPNQLIGLGLISGFFANLSCYGVQGIKLFVLNGAWPVLLLWLLYIVGGLGAGDIKLFMVMSTVQNWAETLWVMVLSVFLAASVSIVLCIKEKKISKRKLHYSFYIATGFLLLCLYEEFI